jgi:hypothetical protein
MNSKKKKRSTVEWQFYHLALEFSKVVTLKKMKFFRKKAPAAAEGAQDHSYDYSAPLEESVLNGFLVQQDIHSTLHPPPPNNEHDDEAPDGDNYFAMDASSTAVAQAPVLVFNVANNLTVSASGRDGNDSELEEKLAQAINSHTPSKSTMKRSEDDEDDDDDGEDYDDFEAYDSIEPSNKIEVNRHKQSVM